MHFHHDRFMQAISENRKVVLTHFTSDRNCSVTRLCIPIDYKPDRDSDYFYVWDPEANAGERLLGLPIW